MSHPKHPGKAVVIGASSGGVEALKKILPFLPKDYPLPIMIVLHLPAGQPSLLQEIFSKKMKMEVLNAEAGMEIRNSVVYFAGPDLHLVVEEDHTFSFSDEAAIQFSKPAIDVLFKSASKVYGKNLLAFLLTGANEDGSDGLRIVQEGGGFTAVQNPITADMPIMPKAGLPYVSPKGILTIYEILDLLLTYNVETQNE
jgi:two-component system, chemotaxis family, protein-glutamate methylesterase/glutaminase